MFGQACTGHMIEVAVKLGRARQAGTRWAASLDRSLSAEEAARTYAAAATITGAGPGWPLAVRDAFLDGVRAAAR